MDQKKQSNNDIDKVIDIDNDKNPQEAQKNDNNKNEIEIQISNSNQQGQIGKGGQARIPGAKTLQKNVNSAMKKYDPYQIPADQHIAELHQKSLRVGPPVLTSTEFCPCCARKVDREPLGINCSLHKFAYLGAGTPLFFMFIKFVILFMVILLIVTGIYNAISSAVLGDYCESDQVKEDLTEEEIQNFCEKNWITLFSLGNKADENNLMNISAILNLVACLIIMGLLQLFRYKQRQWQKELDEIDIAPDDYSVMVKNINFDFKLEQGQKYQTVLEEFLENNLFLDKDGKPQSSEVTNVNLCFKMDEFMKLRQNRKKIKQDLSLLIEKEKETGKWDSKKSKEEYEAKLKDIRTQMKEIQQKFHSSEDQEFIRKHFTGFAFVSFHTEQEKDRCLEEQKGIQYFGFTIKNKNARKFKGKNLIIKPAAKPRDVYWQNFHLSKKSILIRNTLGMLSIFPLLAICFVISYYIMKQQKDLEEDNSDGGGPIQTLLALILGIIISLVNVVLEIILTIISQNEGHRTLTDLNISLSRKLAISQFFNSAIVTFINQCFLLQGDRTNFGVIFGAGGLAYNQYYVFISQALLPIVIEFLDFGYHIIKFKRYLARKAGNFLIQEDLQTLYENPNFEMDIRYSQILNNIYQTAFYITILPLGLFWSILGVFLLYWINKLILLKRRCVKYAYSISFTVEMTEMLELFLPIFGISNIFFYAYISDGDYNGWAVATFIISVVHAMLPMKEFNEKFFQLSEPVPNNETYEEAKLHFVTNYDIENPATRAIARQELIEYKKNKLINKTPQDGQLNDIENKVSEKNSNTSQSNLLNKEKINKVVPF